MDSQTQTHQAPVLNKLPTISTVVSIEPEPEPSLGRHTPNDIRKDESQTQSYAQAVRDHPPAFLWCMYIVWVMLSSNYTNTAGSSVLGIPRFRKDFGHPYQGGYVLAAKWQSAYYGASSAAGVLGAIGAAWLSDKVGRKPILGLALIVKATSTTLQVVATTNSVFFGGLFLNGLSTGALTTMAFTYIGEVSPLALRGIISAGTPMAICLGGLFAAILTNYTGEQDSRWAYRTGFVSEYGFVAVSAVFLPFMPESPWWLVGRGKVDKGLRSLHKLGYSPTQAQEQVRSICDTLDKAKAETSGASYIECFRRSNLRRTIISVAPSSIQALSGVVFVSGYSTYYQQLAGFSTRTSFHLFITQQVLSIFGNFCSWFLIDRVGRRSLNFWGVALLTVLLLITGALAVADTHSTIKATVALILFYCYVYNATIGAAAFTIMTETATARLRAKTASMAFVLQQALFTMWGFVLPYLFNPDKANLGARVAFIFGGLSVLCLIYLWTYQPDTAGLSYEVIDELFIKRVPARQFKHYRTSKTDGPGVE
ncbi:hypothetical protein A1O3_07219 [Capronia epimyces CBS 606.96]|uniref:Major facilitator superfamily (MFS) profile domain-containing protein n=1 Tax=Capronia epimyces CBS 606.96 TaxID=1182542 RepID=W9XVC3_9EURO|nr:uncharacterized protein A1O3_07219 [Capronia epimyces CBS 606.96]EXJ80931.1 hypothetical protein A1O3_07219 [Capronia epimyces CBS 606.96]